MIDNIVVLMMWMFDAAADAVTAAAAPDSDASVIVECLQIFTLFTLDYSFGSLLFIQSLKIAAK